MAKDNETMIPLDPEPKKVEIDAAKLDKLIEIVESQNKKIEVLENTVSRQRQLEAKKALEKEEHPQKTIRLKLWKGAPIVKRETVQHEYRRNPLTNEAIDLMHRIKMTLADGTVTDPIDLEIINTLHDEAVLRQKEVKRVGLEEVWVAEWIDPDLQDRYGDIEISITSSGAVNA